MGGILASAIAAGAANSYAQILDNGTLPASRLESYAAEHATPLSSWSQLDLNKRVIYFTGNSYAFLTQNANQLAESGVKVAFVQDSYPDQLNKNLRHVLDMNEQERALHLIDILGNTGIVVHRLPAVADPTNRDSDLTYNAVMISNALYESGGRVLFVGNGNSDFNKGSNNNGLLNMRDKIQHVLWIDINHNLSTPILAGINSGNNSNQAGEMFVPFEQEKQTSLGIARAVYSQLVLIRFPGMKGLGHDQKDYAAVLFRMNGK